ncbi:hypothetical protein CSOJ01_02673 [Colletotrichum sojae]|uniref:Uncharacterized protein n=1 Tax=Colletotrichum sojae TaxID=2175907 RepID=A0A8H6N2D0_9PEZI|nr:hypothetical protein CSOJ01_02673 [Colletotrichum sojae]
MESMSESDEEVDELLLLLLPLFEHVFESEPPPTLPGEEDRLSLMLESTKGEVERDGGNDESRTSPAEGSPITGSS